jgi:hypothetical protein
MIYIIMTMNALPVRNVNVKVEIIFFQHPLISQVES